MADMAEEQQLSEPERKLLMRTYFAAAQDAIRLVAEAQRNDRPTQAEQHWNNAVGDLYAGLGLTTELQAITEFVSYQVDRLVEEMED